MNRQEELIKLKDFLAQGAENLNAAKELEGFFLGSNMVAGCGCKYNHVRARLNLFWEQTGKAELESLINI